MLQLVIGLPKAGKTTFLAALWYLAESQTVPGSLILERLSDDCRHLNEIKDDWLHLRTARRTNLSGEQHVSMLLKDTETGREGELIFPDLSGETFEKQWADRAWPRSYGDIVRQANSVLLFVHPSHIVKPFTIAQADRLLEAAGEARADTVEAGDSQRQEWHPDKAPTQIKLVDILQITEPQLCSPRPIRLALIVSAWDCVLRHENIGPEQWVSRELPMLHQYLLSNRDLYQTRFYGVSAQGGDFDDAVDRRSLESTSEASERVIIVGSHCSAHDISEPVRWTAGLSASD